LRQATHRVSVPTRGKGLYDFTRDIQSWLEKQKIRTGLLTVFCRHTSASVVIQENADPDVILDIADYFERIAPENDPHYRHTAEGPDDMPAHLRTALTQTSLTIPVIGGRMALGTWQGIYLFEHRSSAHRRSVVLHLMA